MAIFQRLLFSFSIAGLVLGTLFFAASLTPSLLPRTYVTQGLLSGVAMGCGYGLGVLFECLWRWLELPEPTGRMRLRMTGAAGAICGVIVLVFLWRTAEWQNSIRAIMQLPPIETAHPLYVGLIALAGIVVNNNIVLIDTYNILRQSGMDAREAILRTGAQRLRPVMLTTVTTILGLLPMVLGIGIDFINRDVTVGAPSTQWWVQLASAVSGGLLFATVLTLVVTPSMLMIQARREERKRARELHRLAESDTLTEEGA